MLAQIQLAGRTSGLNFDQAMKSAVAVIHKVKYRYMHGKKKQQLTTSEGRRQVPKFAVLNMIILLQDVAEFGGEKHITVGVATLVPSSPSPSPSSDSESDKTKDAPCLQVKAASSSIELAVVGKKLHKRFQRGVSYQAVDSNRPVHVANIQKHGGVHFFISEHKKEEVD